MTRDEWATAHLKRVRFFYGLAMGGVLTAAGVVVIVYDVLTDGPDLWIMAFGGGLVLVGGVAALPGTFMPVFSAILRKLPGASDPGPPPAPELHRGDDEPGE